MSKFSITQYACMLFDIEVFKGGHASCPTTRELSTLLYANNPRSSPVGKLYCFPQKTLCEAKDITKKRLLTNEGFALASQNLVAEGE